MVSITCFSSRRQQRGSRIFIALALLITLTGCLPVWGQVDYSTATLKGTVLDPQGAVIVGATVTATNSGTGLAKTARSASDGTYQILALSPGSYQVAIEAKGFSKQVAKSVVLSVGRSVVFDATLKLGSASDAIEVSGDAAPLIEMEQSQQANTINSQQVEYLPNIGRNFTQNVYTLPGVGNSDAPRSQTPGFTGYLTTGFSIGGSNGRNNLSTIDGGDNEYGTGQYRITAYPVDAIQEYQVNRNGFAAEFGFTDGSAINIVSKSGGNQWHGSAFGYFRNQSTEASNFFVKLQGITHTSSQNAFMGGTLGGPVVKEKLFFFTSYEFQKGDTPNFGNVGVLTAPTVLGLSNPQLGDNNPTFGNCANQLNPATSKGVDQLCYVNALKASGDPFLIGFANGITPGLSPLNNPALKTILSRDNGVFINPDRLHNMVARFDYQKSEKDSFMFRAVYAHNKFTSPLDGIVNGTPDSYSHFVRDFSILGTWNRSISPSLLNQVLVQIVPRNRSEAIPLHNDNGVNLSIGDLGEVGPGGGSTFNTPALLPYKEHQERYQFEDNVTWIKGAHTFKFGGSYRPANYHIENDLWFNPEFGFVDGRLGLIALAPAAVQAHLVGFNLAHGLPATGPATTNLTAPQSFAFGLPVDEIAGFNNPFWNGWGHYFGSYLQDTWRLNSRLTMNAGVRLDFDGEPSPLSTSFYASPRLGFAWDPFGDHKTVIRAGGGIFVAPVDVLVPSYGSLLDGTGRYINEVATFLSPTDPRVAQLWGLGIAKGELPFGKLTAADYAAVGININTPGATVGYSVAPNYKNPYSVQASLSVDRELVKNLSLELGYNMYHGVHLQMPLETAYTQVNPGNPLCATAFASFPGCVDTTGGPLYAPATGQVQHTTYESIGSSIYHGMTASLTKRTSHGLQFQVNYTWSKTIDNVIDFASFQNWFRPSRLDLFRAVSVFDVPHSLVANAVYTTPFKTGSGNIVSSIFADISLAPIVTVHSGLPFSIRTPGLQNGTAIDNGFAMPFHAPRDNNRGAGYATTDLRFTKAVFLNHERKTRLDVIVEGTNIFNRTNFNKVSDVFDLGGIPTVTPTCPVNTCAGIVQTANGPVNLFTGPFTGLHGVKPTTALGVQTPLSFASADLPRQIQFGLKLAF